MRIIPQALNTALLLLLTSLLISACNETSIEAEVEAPTATPDTDATAAAAAVAVKNVSAQNTLPTPPVLTSLNGETFAFENYSDQLILINVWATWCAPCRVEMPDLEELQEQYNPEQFQVIGVAADEVGAVAEYLQTIKVTYPNFIGNPEEVFAWSEKLGNRIVGVPYSAIIDSSGAVRWTKTGGRILVEELEPVINDLIKESS